MRSVRSYGFLLLIFLVYSTQSFSQVTALSTQHRHETQDQRVIAVAFSGSVSGTTDVSQWIVRINGSAAGVSVTGVSNNSTSGFATSITPTGSKIYVQFDASNVASHLALANSPHPYVLPGETLTIEYTGNTITGGGTVAVFGPHSSVNNYAPSCSDLKFANEGNAAAADQCSPVNTSFYRWIYQYTLVYRNSTNFSIAQNFLSAQWNNPANTTTNIFGYLSNDGGNPNTNFYSNTSWDVFGTPSIFITFRPGFNTTTLTVDGTNGSFSYPDNSGFCNFRAFVYPRNTLWFACPSPVYAKNTQFNSYDYDDQNTGSLILNPSSYPTTATSDLVCKGTNVGVKFTDASTFNCIGNGTSLTTPTQGAQPLPINNQQRWVRVIYGGANSATPANNIPNVEVGGVPVTDASGNMLWTVNPILPGSYADMTPNANPMSQGYVYTGGGADANGVIALGANATVSSVVSQLITTSSAVGQVVGQRFYITLQYWNVCNPYPTSAPVEISTDFVEIIGTPVAPSVPSPNVCETVSNTINIAASGMGSGTLTYTWYKDAALSMVLQAASTDNTFNPVTEGPSMERIPTTVTGSTIYHRYVTVTQGGNGCTSLPADVAIQIDDANTAGTVSYSGSNPICNDGVSDPPVITSATAATGGGSGGTVVYQWEQSTNNFSTSSNAVGVSNGLTYDPPILSATTSYRRRASSGTCASVTSNTIKITVDQPVNGGTIGNPQTVCAGVTDPSVLTNDVPATGGNGTFAYQWEQSIVSPTVGFTNATGVSTSATYDPPVLSQTTYYRRKATSGVCTGANNPGYSNVITLTVDQAVVAGSISNAQAICSGDDPLPITSISPASGGNGSVYTYQWEQSTTAPGTTGFSTIGGETGLTYDPPVLTQTTWYRRVATSGACSSQSSNTIEITVNPKPTASSPTGGGAICSGNPAPDIVWTLTGAGPFTGTWTDGTSTFSFSDAGVSQTATELRVSTPNTLLAGTYKLLSLVDANGCVATTLGGSVSITIGGTAPSIDGGSSLSITSACNDGSSTSDPTLLISLDDAGSSNTGPFTLTYKIDGGTNKTKTFSTGASGNPSTPIVLNDTELNTLTPSPHVITLVSLQSPLGCQATLTNTYNFTVNSRPAMTVGAVNSIACSTGGGQPLSVTAPSSGTEDIVWSKGGPSLAAFVAVTAGDGTVSGTKNETFTPTTAATATYYAFTRNTSTTCLSTTGLPVTQTQDIAPTVSNVGAVAANCNGTFLLAANTPNTGIGEIGTWTVPGIIYQQAFASYGNNTTTSTAVNGWTVDTSAPNVFTGGQGHFNVQSNQFELNNADGSATTGAEVVWRTPVIATGAFSNVSISIDLSNAGGPDASDYLRIYYKIDGGAETLINTSNQNGAAVTGTASVSGLSGSTSIQLVVRGSNNAATEFYRFDNILITKASAPTISNPNDKNATVSNIPVGTTVLTWSISSQYGVCAPSTSTVSLTRNPPPIVASPTPSLCEDVFGGGSANNINLNDYSTTITGLTGAYAATGSPIVFESAGDDRRISWFSNAARTFAIDPTDVDGVINGTILYYRVTILSTGCTADGQITFTVTGKPTANTKSYTFCPDALPGNGAASTTATVNLSSIPMSDIIGADPAASRVLTFHATLTDAQAGINPITTTAVTTANTPLQVFTRTRNTTTGCINTSTVTLVLQPNPSNNQIRDALNTPIVDGLTGAAPFTGSTSICASESLVLYQINPATNPGASYLWSVPSPSYTVPPGDPANPGTTPVPEFEVLGATNNYFIILKFHYSTNSPPAGFVSNFSAGIPISVTEKYGSSCAGNALTMTVKVDASPSQPVITGPLEVCENGTATYTISSGSTGASRTWSIPPGATITTSPTGTSITVQMGTFDGQISVTTSSGAGCVSPPATPISVDVIPRPSFTFSVNPLCSGGDVASVLTLTPSISPPFGPSDVTFNWDVLSVAGAVTGTNVGPGPTGVSTINQTLNNVSGIGGTVIYRVTPVGPSSTFCAGNPQNISVTVNPEPVLNLTNKVLCSREPAAYEIKVTPANLPAGVNFSWSAPVMSDGSSQGSAGAAAMGIAGTIHINDSFVNTSSSAITATYTIDAVSAQACSSSQSTPSRQVVFTINPEPVYNDGPVSKCSDEALNVDLTTMFKAATSITATSFTINSIASNGLIAGSGNVSTGAGKNSGALVNDTWTNTGTLPVNVVYSITPFNGTCAGIPFTVTAQIDPEPVYNNKTLIICSGSALALDLNTLVNSSVTATSFTITAINLNGLAPSAGSPNAPVSGRPSTELADDAFINTSSLPVDVIYSITPFNGTCAGTPFTVTATVRPEPVGVLDNTTLNDICSREGFTHNIQSKNIVNSVNSVFAFVVSSSDETNVPTPAALDRTFAARSNAAISGNFINTTNADVTITYHITPYNATGDCPGTPFDVLAVIHPEPVYAGGSANQCSGEALGAGVELTGFKSSASISATTFTVNSIASTGLTGGAGNIVSPRAGLDVHAIESDTWTNTGTLPVNVTYTITPFNGSCSGTPFTVTVQIDPEPVYNNETPVVCSQSAVGLNLNTLLNGSVTATSFTINTIVDHALTRGAGNVIPGAGLDAHALENDTWTNTGSSPVDVVYTITPFNGTCDGTPFTVTATIRPEPVGAMDNTSLNDVCSHEPFTYNIQSQNIALHNGVSSVFEFTVSSSDETNVPTPAGLDRAFAARSNAGISSTFTNTTHADVTITYHITPYNAAGDCPGTPFDLLVNIHPEPKAPSVTTIERCSGEAINFDPQSLVNDPTNGNGVISKFKYTVGVEGGPAASEITTVGLDDPTPDQDLITDAFVHLGIVSTSDVVVVYTITPINNAEDCEGTPFKLRVIIHPQPRGQDVHASSCGTGANVHQVLQSQITNGVPSKFTYQVINDPSNPLTTIDADRVVASTADINFAYTNTTGADATITYKITPYSTLTSPLTSTSTDCRGQDFFYTVTISPQPVGVDQTLPAVCSNIPFSLDPQVNVSGPPIPPGANGVTITSYTWSVADYHGMTANGGPAPASGTGTTTGDKITGSLTNKTSTQLIVEYEVIPKSGACAGPMFKIRLPINPQPVIDPSITPRTVCSDVATNINFGGLGGTITPAGYDVTLSSVDTDLTANPSNLLSSIGSSVTNTTANAIVNDSYTNNHRTNGLFVEYLVTPHGASGDGACVGDNLIVRVEILPEPVMDPTLANVSTCSDVANNVELASDGVSVNASTFIINSIGLQSSGVVIAPGATVGDVTSKLGNVVADPSTSTGGRNKLFIKGDEFTVTKNAAAASRTVVYNVTPKSGGGCFGDPFDVNLQIVPEPTFDYTVPPPACSDAQIELKLFQRATSAAIAQYNVTGIVWQAGLAPENANIAIGTTLTADGSGNYIAIEDKFVNGTSTSLTATYSIMPVAGNSCKGDPVDAVVTIKPSPVVPANLDKVVCNDAVTGITIGTEATSAPAQSFEVVRNALPAGLAAGSYSSGTHVVNGASTTNISADHVINTTNNPLDVTYVIRANTDPSGAGCYGPARTITVKVEPKILIDLTGLPTNTNNAKPDICSTDDTAITLVSPSNPSAGNVTFNFTATPSVAGAVSGFSPGSNLDENDVIAQVLSNSSAVPVNVTYTVTPRANSAAGGNGCIGTPGTTVVSVEPRPKLAATPSSMTVCEGVPLGIDFSSTTVPSTGAASLSFQLTAVEDPNTALPPVSVTGFSTSWPQSYSAGTDVLNDVLTNASMVQQSIRYLFTPVFTIPSGTCSGEPVSVNITVSPRPVLLPFSIDPKCSGETFSIDYTSSVTEADLTSTLATWTYAYTPSGDPDISGASNGAGFELSQVVFNKNADAATVTYSLKAKAFSCESNTIAVPVEVYPNPKITGVPSSVNVCNGATLSVNLASNASNTQYTWQVDDEVQPTLNGATDQSAPVSGPISYVLSNTSTSLGNYTFSITPQVSTPLAGKVCAGDPFTMVANVAPPLDGRITTSNGTDESFICTGSREFIFLEFDGLPLFDAVYREGTNTVTLTRQGAFKPIQVTPSVTTEYELISVKDAFGCTTTLNKKATVNVNNTDATFTMLGPPEACSPYKVSFQYNEQEGVSYTWKWFDGPDSTTYTATSNEIGAIVKHSFENPSPVGVAKFKVYLETSLADPRYPGCSKSTFQEVHVSPNVSLGVFPDVTTICSGDRVTFTNSSQGVGTHRWFYRPQGSTEEDDVRNTVSPSFQLVNETTQNPIIYEIVYKGDNGKCPASVTTPIKVYRAIKAAFDEGTIPPFVAGAAAMTFTNTSDPLTDNGFKYEWSFGENADPKTFTGSNSSVPVVYSLPGLKEVSLTATNMVALADGFSCSSTARKTIEILLPALVAAFQVEPLAACFPVSIKVTENTSTGDTFKWKVVDEAGNIAATALTTTPIFDIVNPGKYEIFLEASSSITNQTAFAQKSGIEIFDKPVASFEARPTTLFVPDTELITFNFSTGANQYNWDFDDGTLSEDFEPKHFYQLEGKYTITLIAGYDHGERDVDGDGVMDGNLVCYDTARREITAREGGLTKIPNAFTPNPNGPSGGGTAGSGTFNDIFLPITKGVAKEDGAFIMEIFDRWGTLVFESRSQDRGWDGYDKNGNLLPAGVYVYKLTLRLADGQRTTQVGDVTVIR